MAGHYYRFLTRRDFLEILWNKRNVRSVKKMVKEIQAAEDKGILVIKGDVNRSDEQYEKNIRWYLSDMERKGMIEGFSKEVGRPKKYFTDAERRKANKFAQRLCRARKAKAERDAEKAKEQRKKNRLMKKSK